MNRLSRFALLSLCVLVGSRPTTFAQSTVGTSGELGGANSQTHSSGRFYTYWDMPMDPDYRYTIDLTSADFDTLLTIQEGTRRIAEDDDGGAGTNSHLVFTPSRLGTYRIGVTSFAAGQRGKFQITIRSERLVGPSAPGNDTEVAVNDNLTGERKEHFFPVVNGARYQIMLQSGAGRTITRADGTVGAPPGFFDTVLRVEYEDGTSIGSSDDISWPSNSNSQLEFTATRDGNIRIIVTSFRTGETGPYRLTMRR